MLFGVVDLNVILIYLISPKLVNNNSVITQNRVFNKGICYCGICFYQSSINEDESLMSSKINNQSPNE